MLMLLRMILHAVSVELSLACSCLATQMLDRAHFLPHIGSGAETRGQFQGLVQALEEYSRKTFSEWTQTVDKVRTTGGLEDLRA